MSHSVSVAAPTPLNIMEEMAKHGITYTASDVFHVDGYRYSHLRDAIAQAKRARSRDVGVAGPDWRTW